MEYILFCYIGTIFFHVPRNEIVLRSELAIKIEKRGLKTSLQEKRNYYPKILLFQCNLILLNSITTKIEISFRW